MRRRVPASIGLTSMASAAGAAGQEAVGLPVEEEQDRHVGEAAARLLQPEVEGHGHAAHVADLQVDDDEVGLPAGHDVADVVAPLDLDDLEAGPAQGGPDVVADPVGVAGHQDGRHGRRLPVASRAVRSGGGCRAEQVAPDLGQAGDVAHLHLAAAAPARSGTGPDRPFQPLEVAALPLRQLDEVGQVGVELAQPAGRRADAAADRTAVAELGMDPVDHQAVDPQAGLLEAVGEVAGLGDGVPGRGGHQHEGRAAVGQELA